jgi:hypothetical protein
MSTRRETILNVADDLVGDFLYYNRRNSESLPMGAIEEAVLQREITVDEIVEAFSKALKRNVKQPATTNT